MPLSEVAQRGFQDLSENVQKLALRAKGKKPVVAMTAILRKLIILINRLLKYPNLTLAT